MIEVYVVYGEDRQSLKAYAFNTIEEVTAFKAGIDEALGWREAHHTDNLEEAIAFQKYGEI